MTLYAKSVLAIVAAAIGILVTGLSDNVLTPTELTNVAIVIVTALGVYLVPNLPEGPAKYLKFAVALLGAALVTLSSLLDGGVTTSEWLQVALAALTALGVYVVPNTPILDAGTYVPGTPSNITNVFAAAGQNVTELAAAATAEQSNVIRGG
jgi:hypothetical protein